MKEKKLIIQIRKPIADVFDFVINPKNTPKWIDSIVVEETNEWPVKLGTIYRNRGENSDWSEYKMTEFEPNKMFVMKKENDNYSVRYTLNSIDADTTELEYYEWADEGELEDPFSYEIMEKLKTIIESDN